MKSLNFIVLLGPPGGGKGTLSKLCVDKLGWLQLSTGNLCRDNIARKTEIGKKIDFLISSGKLIGDNLIVQMVDEWLTNNTKLNSAIILDGYPRTVVQVKALLDLLNQKFTDSKLHIIRLLINEKAVINRLSSRIVCSNSKCQVTYSNDPKSPFFLKEDSGTCIECKSDLIRRNDDQDNSIMQRLEIYNQHESELLEYYSKVGLNVININADQSIENIFSEFRDFIS